MTEELNHILSIKNNLLYTREDLKNILMIEKNDYKKLSLENKAEELHKKIRQAYYKVGDNNKKNRIIELLIHIEELPELNRSDSIRLELELKEVLTLEQFSIYQMLIQDCPLDYICEYFNICLASLYNQKKKIKIIIDKIRNNGQ